MILLLFSVTQISFRWRLLEMASVEVFGSHISSATSGSFPKSDCKINQVDVHFLYVEKCRILNERHLWTIFAAKLESFARWLFLALPCLENPPYLSPQTKIPMVTFFRINMRSLYAKFQLYSFKTEGGVWGDRWTDDIFSLLLWYIASIFVHPSLAKIYHSKISKHFHSPC